MQIFVLFLVLTVILTVFCFVGFRAWLKRPSKITAFCLVASWSLTLLSLILALAAKPTDGNTDVVVPDGNRPDLSTTAIERLQTEWDAELRQADWPVAESLALLSELAYLPPVSADKEFRKLGFTEVMTVVENSMIAYVISGEDVTIIVFRGTNFYEVGDWIKNLRVDSRETQHGRAHRGFYEAYQSMKPQIEEILQDRKADHLWITGHSLGGALAVMCAYDFIDEEERNVDGVITFGQPLVAKSHLAEHLNATLAGRYVRFVNGQDIVPKVPGGHSYFGSMVWFNNGEVRRSYATRMAFSTTEDGQPEIDIDEELRPLTEEEFELLQAEIGSAEEAPRGTPGEPAALTFLPQFDDHSMTLYVEKVRKHLGVE